jgi:hypothetical protein
MALLNASYKIGKIIKKETIIGNSHTVFWKIKIVAKHIITAVGIALVIVMNGQNKY